MSDTSSKKFRFPAGLAKFAGWSRSTEDVARGLVDDRLDGLSELINRPLPSRGYIVRQ